MTRKASWRFGTALLCGMIARVAIFPQTGGSNSILFVFIFTIPILALFHIPWKREFRWLTWLRDVVIIFGINIMGGVICGAVAGLCRPEDTLPPMALFAMVFFLTTAGFSIVGILAPRCRLARLGRASLGVWLANSIELIYTPATWQSWLVNFFIVSYAMWAGNGIAFLVGLLRAKFFPKSIE